MGGKMESYEFNGEKYYFNKGKWLKSDYTVAPIGVINSLNMLLMEREEFKTKTVDEIIQMLDGAKMSGNTGFALKMAEESMEKATLSEARALLPRITSLYRIKNRPERAVEVGEHYIRIYESEIWSPSLFTSLAAAYCDLNELEKARKYANRARAISGNNSSIELMSVYSRLKKLEEESPNIVRRDKEVEEVCDSILEPGNSEETLNVNAKEKDILAFIEALQNGADPMTGEILAEDSFIYAAEMQEILEIAKEKIKAEASQDEKKTFENIIDKEEQTLYEELRECRMKIAKEYGIPAYTICHNSTLEEICRVKPSDRWEMLSISGVGEKAYEKYGDAFLNIINNQS